MKNLPINISLGVKASVVNVPIPASTEAGGVSTVKAPVLTKSDKCIEILPRGTQNIDNTSISSYTGQ